MKKSTPLLFPNAPVTEALLARAWSKMKRATWDEAVLTRYVSPQMRDPRHGVVHQYVLARLAIERGDYVNALMHYSMGYADIAKVARAPAVHGIYRAYNIHIRTVLERALATL